MIVRSSAIPSLIGVAVVVVFSLIIMLNPVGGQTPTEGMTVMGQVSPGELVFIINLSKVEQHIHNKGAYAPFCEHVHGRNDAAPPGAIPNDGLFWYVALPDSPCNWEPGDQLAINRWIGDYEPVIVTYLPGTEVDVGELPWSLGRPWPMVSVAPVPVPTATVTPTETSTPTATATATSTPSSTATAEPTATPDPVCKQAYFRDDVLMRGPVILCPD
jgi:hypothetical protein